MENNNDTLEGCSRCPTCHKAPEVKFQEAPFKITLLCEKDGHMAMGDSIQSVKAHWNRYAKFFFRVA